VVEVMEGEGVVEGEGEGVMEGEVVLGRRCRPWALVVREWGVVIGHMHSPFVGGRSLLFVGGGCPLLVLGVVRGRRVSFVGGGARSGCWVLFVGAGFLFVGAELLFVGCGAHSHVVHVCGWGAVVRGWVCVQCTFVGGLFVSGLFVGGLLFVGAVAPCCMLYDHR
jgi:hypothetical protein